MTLIPKPAPCAPGEGLGMEEAGGRHCPPGPDSHRLLLSVTLLSQCGQSTGQQQVSSHRPREAVREGRSRPRALEAEQGGRMPVTNEDLLKVTAASASSMMHVRVYKLPWLCREHGAHGCLPHLHPHSPVPAPALCAHSSGAETSGPLGPSTSTDPREEGPLLSVCKDPGLGSSVPRVALRSSFLSQIKLSQRTPASVPLREAEQRHRGRGRSRAPVQ